MYKSYFITIVFVLLWGFTQGQSATKPSIRPNIILFLVDDMGWQDCSVPFADKITALNKRYHTPNMERLAREGMKFTNAYANPVCTPTRISLITGLNAAHHHVTNWTSPVRANTDRNDEQFSPAPWMMHGLSNKPGVPFTVHATTFPQVLKDNGYFTIHTGKAHWGSQGAPGANPYNLGFIVNISGHAAGQPQSYQGKDNYGNPPGRNATVQAVPDLEAYYGSETFLTEAHTLEAMNALDLPIKNKQPFFLHIAHYAVHTPIQADRRFFQRYVDKGLDTVEAAYASLIEGMDKSLGDLMDFVKEKGVEKNTIIIFMSDNGGLSLVPPRDGEQHTHNLPLKAGKGSLYEGGIREPMLVKWPGVTKPGSVAHQYVIAEDFFPTILEMAQVKQYKTIHSTDGKSFVPVLRNARFRDTARTLIWHFPNKWQPKDGPAINYVSAIREGDWKMIYFLRNGRRELYNLRNDIGETSDLSPAYPGIVAKLTARLAQKLKAWKAPMPIYKASGKPVPFPGMELETDVSNALKD